MGGNKRTQKNNADHVLHTTNEEILQSIVDIYTAPENEVRGKPFTAGVKAMADLLGVPCNVPRKKITVALVGNHSAGKSSFINWYIGENIQRTGVAIETAGFTIVTTGKKRESYKGEATLQLFKHLVPLIDYPGLVENLITEICASKERAFSLVDFIDTPGLADGQLEYPFDVDKVLYSVGEHCDLILVFFDPVGQALCNRTMNVVCALNEKYQSKIRYYLSKADQVPKEEDRQKVLIQITQNLSSQIKCAHAFELPTIYIPDIHEVTGGRAPTMTNAIEDVCVDIDRTINFSVQNALKALKDHCTQIDNKCSEKLAESRANSKYNLRVTAVSLFEFILLLEVLVLLVLASVDVSSIFHCSAAPPSVSGLPPGPAVTTACIALQVATLGGSSMWIGSAVVLLLLIKFTNKKKNVLSNKDTAKLKDIQAHVNNRLTQRHEELYKQYFSQTLHEMP